MFFFSDVHPEDGGRCNPIDNMYSFETVVVTHQLLP